MKYQKYITVMQMAMGVTASNKDCLPAKRQLWVTPPDGETSPAGAAGCSDGPVGATGGAGALTLPATSTLSLPVSQGKPSLRRIKGRIHRSKSLDSIDLLDSNSAAMEETVIWEQHTVTLHRAAGFGFGIAISGGRDNPHFQSGETSIVISDVLKGGPAEGLLQENDRVVMVNAVSMDNVEHAYAVQQLRKSGKNAKITIRRKRKIQIPASRAGDRETMSEREEETDEEDGYDHRGRSGQNAYAGASGSMSRQHDRERSSSGKRDHSASREMSVSPRSDRRSQTSSAPLKPAKVTLVKSRKNEEYGLRLASHIFVKDISPESLAARDGNIREGDVVLKINGTVTENLSLTDAKKLIERSKGKLKMVVQRDERATLLNIPDLDDSIPSANNSDRDDISEIHSLTSDHSNRSHGRGRSRSPDRHELSEHLHQSPRQMSNGSHRSRDEDRISKPGAISSSGINLDDGASSQASDQGSSSNDKVLPPLPEPKPVYAQPGQPDVDLPVSPTDAPVPSAAHDDSILRPSMKLVKFKKGESVGLRLAGGNDVGIFVAGVLEDSPAAKEGLEEGDQILRVNNVDFANIIREEAVLFLLDLPRGEEITILAQKKKDVYRKIVESDVGDSFYIRTHFEYEKESPYGLSFNKGEVFRVVDTLYNGKLGSWLAIRIGKNHQEVERGIIPNKNRAEQLSSVQYTLPKTPGGDRADFWRFRGLRSSKRNLRKSREDLSAQPVQTKFPAYERVVLREAGFLRPVVIFGPIADVAREKLARADPDTFELAKTQQQQGGERSEPRDAGTDQKSSGIIRLHTIKQIIDQDKHAVLDITPNAVDRLNYAQWYPIVVFLNPDSKQGVKTMRTRLCPESRKSARKLYDRALKLRKNNQHLFTTTINLNSMNEGWFGALKETVQQQQNQLVWVSEGKADGVGDDDLDIHDDRLSYLSAPGSEYSMYSTDSRHTSDYEDTDTEGGAYTDQELDETLNDDVGPPIEPAITRSSEPVREDPPVIQEPPGYAGYQHSVQADPLNRIDPAGFKAPAPQQMFQKDPYGMENMGRTSKPAAYSPQQLYRDYDHPPSRYDVNNSGGFPDSKYRNYDNLPYENSVPHYDQQQWGSYNQPQHSATNPQSYDLRTPYSDSSDPQYTPPLRFDEPPPQTGFDGRPRYGKPTTGQGPIRFDEPPPPFAGSDLHYNQESPLNTYPSATRSPEPPAHRPAYNQGPTLQQKGYKPHQYDPAHTNSESSLTPPHKAEAPSPSRDQLPEDDPAMRPQSVLTRVKMFENKRSVSVDRARDAADSSNKADDSPLKAGGVIPKANSLSNLDQEKPYRAPDAQRPQPKANEDIVRSNHYDPDEDEDFYRKQLSLLDRLQAGPNKPQLQAQTSQSFPRTEIVEKPSPAEKKYEPIPHVTPSLPPATLPKPSLEAKAPAREDTVQTNFLPHKSFPEKSPVNGTGDQPPKTAPTTGAPSGFNRFAPKPFITSAKPYTRMFDSPKFSHNLLPNDKPETAPKGRSSSPVKPQIPQQPQNTENELRPKYQQNNVNAMPKAIPVSPSALEDDEEDEGHTVVATARGIFNSNGGVLSSIETGVSIIIPQGAIPDGVEQEIYFKVCRDNSILPPLDKEKGETLLSPLVMCGPHGLKFLKPVELRLPHCASMTPDGWSFALKSSDSSSGDPKSWQNKSLPGDPNYLVGANCVSVLIDHF
ncbi:tight junction protein ZO-1 isoform X7 [Oryzias melastigma]|uniref:tight junction protein ZO-1 isoform X7 n=1 Tax=Oryzias melastigma TaxID=30732 RepID=UPI000CF7F39B|nr:tight junction protein ZO-1 isoform X7 [Oryzias melastigma]